MRRFFHVYQVVAPLVLTPLAYALWLDRLGGDPLLAIYALSLPVVVSYVIPGIGTNVLGLWEFHTRLRVGRFRPHHGFLFGSATAVLAWACSYPLAPGAALAGEALRTGFILGTTLAFWNWLYDIHAIRSGFITVYNAPYRRGEGAEAVATDYAPLYFGSFGFCYGVVLRLGEGLAVGPGLVSWSLALVLLLALPAGAYVLSSYLRTGQSGLSPQRP
ncbi:MAG: hypothetical protein HY722_07745 [Planctomycetes bacterium]|nr:hypothetical protein [Planctomycetota bacterium]